MLKTPLNSWHHANRGRMVDFAGWEMPVQYSSIVDEHTKVRSAAGLFGHFSYGRWIFRGAGGETLLNSVLTNDTARLKVGDIRYSLVLSRRWRILDDVLVYTDFRTAGFLVVNAPIAKRSSTGCSNSRVLSATVFRI